MLSPQKPDRFWENYFLGTALRLNFNPYIPGMALPAI
jgi:hypothetical protein